MCIREALCWLIVGLSGMVCLPVMLLCDCSVEGWVLIDSMLVREPIDNVIVLIKLDDSKPLFRLNVQLAIGIACYN